MPAGTEEPSCEPEPRTRRERRTRHGYIEEDPAIGHVLAAAREHDDVGPPHRGEDGAKERGALRERLDERDGEIGPEERERETGGARTRADIDDARASRDVLSEDERVREHQVDELGRRPRRREIDLRVPVNERVEPRRERALLLEREHPPERRRSLSERPPSVGLHEALGHRSQPYGARAPRATKARLLANPYRVTPDLSKLHDLLGSIGRRAAAIEPMPGGASLRRYSRIRDTSGASFVAMFVPDGDKPEEIQNGEARAHRWPFLEVRDLLAARGVEVPRVLAEDTRAGWLVLEDLGDDTLAAHLSRRPERKAELYTRAVTDLAAAQEALATLPESSIVTHRAFDEELLLWELDHFREWGLDARNKALSPGDRQEFDRIARGLAKRIASFSRGFVHRDYQSRNLMVEGSRLVWIDFQDALLGPRVYDLVALLNDSYQEFDAAFVDARLDDYARARGLEKDDRARLRREFDQVTVQRKLKDAGRFVFIDRVKKNPAFLQFVGPTMKKVTGAIGRLASEDADMKSLGALLCRALPEEV